MSILSAVRSLFQRTPAPVRHANLARQNVERSFAAMMPGVATNDLLRMHMSPNELARSQLFRMRQQSRALALNNDYVRAFLRSVEQNVVGPDGVKVQLRVRDPDGSLDMVANRLIEGAFATWCKPSNCDVSGKKSFRSFQKVAMRTLARDGEVFIRKVKRFPHSVHRFGLQLIPSELVYEGYWDSTRNIVCGIERDEWDRPTAYWLRQDSHTEVTIRGIDGSAYLRIPADEMVHVFLEEFPGQVRGFPWLHTSMIRLHQLGAYEEAEVIAARLGASKMGFVTSPTGDGSALADGKDANDYLTSSVSPGSIDVLPEGYTFTPFDPTHPSGNYGPFIKATLRGIASGLGVSYNVLASDLEGVNYSSIRSGLLEEREQWRALQRELGEQMLDKIFPDWLSMAFLVGAVAPLPATKFDKFNAPVWHYRGWAWVDPGKDVDASIAAVGAGFKTRTAVLAEQGLDIVEVYEQLKAEQDLIREYGLDITTGKPSPAPAPVPKPAAADTETESEDTGEEVEAA